jgi:hypothetical protein
MECGSIAEKSKTVVVVVGFPSPLTKRKQPNYLSEETTTTTTTFIMMKISCAFFAAAAVLAPATTSVLAFQPRAATPRLVDTSLNSVGLYYSTSTGNTETVAGYIASAAGIEAEEIGDVKSGEDMLKHDAIIVGAPTWHTGADEQRSGTEWDNWLYKELPKLDM